jgi:osmotically-inducible protein OsmY
VNTFALILGAAALAAAAPNTASASTFASSVAPLRVAYQAQAQSGTPAEDLAAKVKAQIDANQEFSGSEITVTADAGVVTLRGVAPTAVVRLKIVEMAQATEGVTRVVNRVTIAKKK